ncbi:DUF6703 family protein [Salinactinospora qingdaonensis]|uniref:Uncharacterized protein n=1 Tax=Salinactinospora qingdaonensis TaxID=702744 RepID=A0ABP7FX25_9ACTN
MAERDDDVGQSRDSAEGPQPAAAPPGSLRRKVEERSAVPLVFLHNAPSWVLPVTVAVLFLAGLALQGPVGAILLTVLAVFFAWLAYLTWPRFSRTEKAARCVLVSVVLALALLQTGLFAVI